MNQGVILSVGGWSGGQSKDLLAMLNGPKEILRLPTRPPPTLRMTPRIPRPTALARAKLPSMRTIFVALVSLFAATLFADGPDCPVTYGYSGFAQPSQWEYLSKDTALCGKGKTQSPVRLTNVNRTKGDVVHFDYHASKMTL